MQENSRATRGFMDDDGNPRFVQQGDYGLTFQAINNKVSPGSGYSVTVSQGDTLAGLAQAHWGDASLWWKIAEANPQVGSAGPSGELKAGLKLNMASQLGGLNNTADTNRTYDPSQIIGDTTPYLPAPPQDDGCGVLGIIIMIIVAVVVSVVTYGALAGQMGALVAAAIAGAAASAASQLVGMAMGNVKDFSWKAVGQGALMGFVTAGIGAGIEALAAASDAASVLNTLVANKVAFTAVKAALATAAIGAAKSEFSWRAVVAAGVSSYVGQSLGESLGSSLGDTLSTDFDADFGIDLGREAGKVLGRTIGSAAGGLAGTMITQDSSHISRQQAIGAVASSLGNAMGEGITDRMRYNQAITEAQKSGRPYRTDAGRGTVAYRDQGGQFGVNADYSLSGNKAPRTLGALLRQQADGISYGGADMEELVYGNTPAAAPPPATPKPYVPMPEQAEDEPGNSPAIRVNGLTFSQDHALRQMNNAARSGVVGMPDPEQAFDWDVKFADASRWSTTMTDSSTSGPRRESLEQAAKNLSVISLKAELMLDGESERHNDKFWQRTKDLANYAQNNLAMSQQFKDAELRQHFVQDAKLSAFRGQGSLAGFYLDMTPAELAKVSDAELSSQLETKGSLRADRIALNAERLLRTSIVPRLENLPGAYENRYAWGEPTIENAVLFPERVGDQLGSLDLVTTGLNMVVPVLGQMMAAGAWNKREATAQQMYDIGLLDKEALGNINALIQKGRDGLVTDLALSMMGAASKPFKVLGGLLFAAEDAQAGVRTKPGSMARAGVNAVMEVAGRASGAALALRAQATVMGRVISKSTGAAIDAVKASGLAAETYVEALAVSKGYVPFQVQRGNGTGFDLVIAKFDKDGLLQEVKVLDVKNTTGTVDKITAFGAGAKQSWTYPNNLKKAQELIGASGHPSRMDVIRALQNNNFELAVVTAQGAKLNASLKLPTKAPSSIPTLLPWLP